MSKTQEKMVQVGAIILTWVLAFGIAYGTIKAELCSVVELGVSHEKRISTVEGNLREFAANQKWLMESNKRIENKLDK